MPYRNVHHYPSCRRVAGEAVAARYQTAVDPWPVQNGREGSGSRLSFAGRLRGRWIEESNQMRRVKASWGRADFEVCGQREVLEEGTLYGDRVATKLPIIAKTMRAVSRSGVRRRDKAAGRV